MLQHLDPVLAEHGPADDNVPVRMVPRQDNVVSAPMESYVAEKVKKGSYIQHLIDPPACMQPAVTYTMENG